MNDFFQKAASYISTIAGSWGVSLGALIIVLGWLLLGPLMHFSDTWQLMISTVSSVVTFLMVFLIQYAQNKDTKSLHLKLDELIRIHKRARNELLRVEQEPEEFIEEKIDEISKISKKKNTSEEIPR